MNVINEIARERNRQIEVEGWTPEHDDTHRMGQMALAAGCYAIGAMLHNYWPWDSKWWNPGPTRRRDLIKAAALIVAEIERLDRASATSKAA